MTEQQFNNQFFRKGMSVKLANNAILPILGVNFDTMYITIGKGEWVHYSRCEVYYNELLDLFKDIVSQYLKISPEHVVRKIRQGQNAVARHLLMIMAYDSGKYTQQQIATYCNCKNHDTVTHAHRVRRYDYDIISHLKVIKIENGHLIKNIEKYKCFKT
jgi:hypothetical protein